MPTNYVTFAIEYLGNLKGQTRHYNTPSQTAGDEQQSLAVAYLGGGGLAPAPLSTDRNFL